MSIRVESAADIAPHLRSANALDPYIRARQDPKTDKTAFVLTGMIGGTGGFNGPDAAFDLHNRHFMTTESMRGPVAKVLDDALVSFNHLDSHDGQTRIAYVALQPWTLRYDRRAEQDATEVFFTPTSSFLEPQHIAAQGLWLLMSGQVNQTRSLTLKDQATARRTHADLEASRRNVHDALRAMSRK